METFEKIYGLIGQYLHLPYLLTFMLLTYLVKKYFTDFLERITPFKWQTVYACLALATIVSIPFLLAGVEFVKIIFSYALGTSLHEILFKLFEKKANELLKK